MFAEERQVEIVKRLEQNGTVKVNELSRLFRVTEETIRRDLEKLEVEQRLKRIHGGAILTVNDDDDIPFQERKIARVKEKKRIAKAAVKLVLPNDVIFIDAGSTGLYSAKELPDISLKVITNSLLVAFELNQKKNVEVILTGGNLTKYSMSLIGPATLQMLETYHIHKMFFSCKGFDVERGISDSNEHQAAIKRAIIEKSDEVILLMDHTKVNNRAFVYIDHVSILTTIVVDDQADPQHFVSDSLQHVEKIFAK